MLLLFIIVVHPLSLISLISLISLWLLILLLYCSLITAAATTTTKVAQQTQVHRYLVVSRERFLVLDASGGGVGSEAVVKSNRHLTEVRFDLLIFVDSVSSSPIIAHIH